MSENSTQQPAATECPAGQHAYKGNCLTDPILVRKRQPKYPRMARKNRMEARVTLKAVIQKDGKVVNPVVEECTTPDYGFEAAAIEAVKRWRYVPVKVNGEIKDVYFKIVVDFTLR